MAVVGEKAKAGLDPDEQRRRDDLKAAALSGTLANGEGLRVRLSRVPGETPRGVLPGALVLPAALGNVGWTEEAAHTEYETVRAGQFSQPAMGPASARSLRTIEDIETLTLTWNPVWLVERNLDPETVRRTLTLILRHRKPVELMLTRDGGTQPLLRDEVTFRSITTTMRQGEPDTLYFTVRLKEWRNASGKRRAHGEGRGSDLPRTIEIDANDTLHKLSMRFYHSALGARAIAAANDILNFGVGTPLVKHPKLKVGSKIKIPKPPASTGVRPSSRGDSYSAG